MTVADLIDYALKKSNQSQLAFMRPRVNPLGNGEGIDEEPNVGMERHIYKIKLSLWPFYSKCCRESRHASAELRVRYSDPSGTRRHARKGCARPAAGQTIRGGIRQVNTTGLSLRRAAARIRGSSSPRKRRETRGKRHKGHI
jgi:hypothetical protein